jgi:preprotein translocase subunit SecG
MLWKLTPDQLDRFLLVAAAILTVVFAIVALALAFLAS